MLISIFARKDVSRRLLVCALVSALLTGAAACRRLSDVPDPSSPEYRQLVSVFYVGLAALQVGDDQRADDRLKQATQIAPGEPAGWANWGLLSLRQKEFDQAAERLEKARARAPDNGEINFLLGLLESSRGQSARSIDYYRRAAELDPKNLRALYALASETEREGGEEKEPEVLALLDRILIAQPDNLAAQLDVARLAAKRGDAEKLRRMIGRFDEKAAAWPSEVREQLTALKTAAGVNTRQAASRVAFLRNVLARVPEFRTSVAAIKLSPDVVGEPLSHFVILPTPEFSPSDPDQALAFEAAPLANAETDRWAQSRFVDPNGEDHPLLMLVNNQRVQIGAAKLDFPGGGGAAATPGPNAVADLDFDYDFKTDLVFAGAGGARLFKQESPTKFSDVTARTELPAAVLGAAYAGAWSADVDSDGDLDVVLGAREGAPIVLRNNGDGTFKDLRPFAAAALRQFVWADLDGDGDPDAALLDARGELKVYANERGGQFRPRPIPGDGGSRVAAINVADVDHDSLFDLLLLAADSSAVRRLSDEDEGQSWRTGEVVAAATGLTGEQTSDHARLHVADLDNNGGVDLLLTGANGSVVWLSDKVGKFVRRESPVADRLRFASLGDLNGDNLLDVIGLSETSQFVGATNRSSKNYRWQTFRPRAANATGDQRINSFGVGGEMELRSGSLVQKQLMAGPVVRFGLGEGNGADVVRVVWPNGSVRAEFELQANQRVLAEQRLKGSCPALFAFDGERMKFVKDCAPWSPALGLKINAQDTLGIVQTEEWMKIRGDQLAPRDGYYDLRITAELWETYYIDHYSLIVVDHPAGTEIYADERFAMPPPKLKIYPVAAPRQFSAARDDGGRDVSAIVGDLDDRYLDNFGRGAYQGVTRDHYVELEIADEAFDRRPDQPLYLIAHGWLHPTDASINVAIGQGRQTPPRGLSVEVADNRGGWTVARPNEGFPAGKNKAIVLDLTDVFLPGAPRRLRLRTNMEIYWDQLTWARGLPDDAVKRTRVAASSAELVYRGFSEISSADASSPELPDYDRLAGTAQRWRDLVGYYTRHGDIKPLLEKIDDRFAIVNAGDEMRFRFPVLPPPAAGDVRDFVIVGDGWIKDGDLNSVFSRTVLPLPTHASNDYSAAPRRLEDDPVYRRFPQDWQDYHTRYVTPERFQRGLLPAPRR